MSLDTAHNDTAHKLHCQFMIRKARFLILVVVWLIQMRELTVVICMIVGGSLIVWKMLGGSQVGREYG